MDEQKNSFQKNPTSIKVHEKAELQFQTSLNLAVYIRHQKFLKRPRAQVERTPGNAMRSMFNSCLMKSS